MLLTNRAYNILKWITMYLLPAMGTLYFALAGIWGLPYGEQIIGTLTAIDTFLAVILRISTSAYNKTEAATADGQLLIDTSDEEKDTYLLQINTDLSELANKSVVTLRVETKDENV